MSVVILKHLPEDTFISSALALQKRNLVKTAESPFSSNGPSRNALQKNFRIEKKSKRVLMVALTNA